MSDLSLERPGLPSDPARANFRDEEMPYAELLAVVRSVRNRWRLKLLLRGLIVVVGIGFLAFAASVWAMNYFLYSDGAVAWFRWLTWIALVALVVRFLVLPLTQRAPNRRVALYIEEHEPSLQSAVLSAVELGEQPSPSVSPLFQRRLLETAIERCEQIDYAQGIERTPLRRFSSALAGVAGAGALAVLLSPAFLQHGALLLFAPWRALADQNPYKVQVSPGDLEVPRGSDQRVAARLLGFSAATVELLLRYDGDQDWKRWPLTASDAADLFGPIEEGAKATDMDIILLDLQRDAEYMVEADGVSSPLHRLHVVDIPYVDRIDLVYNFPSYTGLEPQLLEDAGDIAVLRGSRVELRIFPTVPVTGGWLRVEGVPDEQDRELHPGEDGVLLADLEVNGSGFYRIELADHRGALHRASPEYRIDALLDQAPILRVSKPGRDIRANKIEEIFIEASAEDDFGLERMELAYSVNGGEEQRVALYSGGPQKQLKAGHTLFLEELDLQDGDFVSYYVEAKDGNRFGGSQSTTSDIYFVEVRPFGQDYRRAPEGAQGMGAGGGLDTSLSMQQRQIIAATFKLKRDRKEFQQREYQENLTTVGLSQGRLKEQVQTLMIRMQNRAQLAGDEDFQKILDELGLAVPEMTGAEEQIGANQLDEALQSEQRAMTHLQRAESVFRDVRVSFQQGGGAGGGGESQLAEDLADLFELELDKLRNQYEVVQRGNEQQVQQEIDELEQRLKELARRQQQENERRARMAGQPTGGSGGGQQDLVNEAEEIARRLERLAREQSRPELRETAQRLREAADEMRRTQAARGNSQGASTGISALDRLKEARRLLDKNRDQQFDQQLEELGKRAQQIDELEQRIAQQIDELGPSGSREQQGQRSQGQQGSGGRQQGQQSQSGERGGQGQAGESDDPMSRILERKDRLQQQVEELEDELDRMARQARSESPEVARKLQEAANSVRNNQLKEKIRYSKAVVENRDERYARMFENEIRRNIEETLGHVGEARNASGQSAGEKKEDALAQARDLVESLESLERRIREQTSGDQAKGEQGRGEGQGEQDGEKGKAARAGKEQGEQGEQGEGDRAGERMAQGDRADQQGEQGRQGERGDQGDQPGQGGRRLRDRGQEGDGQQGDGQQGDGQQGEGDGSEVGSSAPGGARGSFSRMGASDGGSFQPGTFSTEDLRQLSKEMRQRLAEAQRLRENLSSQGLELADLDEIMRQMNRFNIRGLNNDPLALEQLKQQVVEQLRQFEFRIWRELEGGSEVPVRLSGDERVPPGYEERVEEYFRALARNGSR